MGGGCDVFMAYTLAKMLNNMMGKQGTGEFLYANCISERKDGIPSDHNTLIPNVLHTVPPGQPRQLVRGENTYGTTFIEQSVPRGEGGSPFLLELKGHKGIDTDEKLREQTETNCSRIDQALNHLQIDLVFGVDCGGDSLTGGKDHAPGMILSGRDQQVLYAFWKYRAVHTSDFDFLHIVLGPGVDAETKEEDMIREVLHGPFLSGENQMMWCEGRKFLGAFSIEKMIQDCFPLVQALEPNRTPYLMYRALTNTIETPQEGDTGYVPGKDCVKISRHGNYEVIPRSWLINGLVFSYDHNCARCNCLCP